MILVVATANPGKLREYRTLLDGLGVTLRSLAEVPQAPPFPPPLKVVTSTQPGAATSIRLP